MMPLAEQINGTPIEFCGSIEDMTMSSESVTEWSLFGFFGRKNGDACGGLGKPYVLSELTPSIYRTSAFHF